uniref:GOLD domain-containing protein n=1 Tax=Panagrolaimus sp. ES5 TaxID=591445 RepID=A0AC34GWU7_9BILA
MKLSFLIFAFLLGLTYAEQDEVIMAIVVEAGKTECLYQDLTNPKYVAFELDYQVTEGGDHDINFMIRNPAGMQIFRDDRKTDANHRIEVGVHGRGDYAICFDNSFSIQTKKTVFFELYLLDEKGNYLNSYDLFADANKAKAELSMQISDFDRITTKVKNNLNRMEQLQSQLRAVESRDRSVMESNFERVNFWSFVNLFVMIFVSGLQLFLLRSLFEENSKVGRLIRSGKLD